MEPVRANHVDERTTRQLRLDPGRVLDESIRLLTGAEMSARKREHP